MRWRRCAARALPFTPLPASCSAPSTWSCRRASCAFAPHPSERRVPERIDPRLKSPFRSACSRKLIGKTVSSQK
ncbi:hypothetical protein BOSE127_140555 [Bosea sp. 127]|nr:hypothetical protein BOSE127_140555 [Bosea sp. 127]